MVTGRSYESAIIILTGRGTPSALNDMLCNGLKPFVSATVRIECPSAPERVGFGNGNEWISNGQESIENMEKAVKFVENMIDELRYDYGIDSRNIVLAGLSQGGAVALYTALNTKYKLGGIIGIVTWLPRLLEDPPQEKKYVRNADTPLLQLIGEHDNNVPLEMGIETRDALSQVITDYTWSIYPGGHGTCCIQPFALREIVKWLDDNTSVSVRLCWIPLVC